MRVAQLEVQQIWDRLPHRYPFLLIDRVVELVEGQRVVAVKNVTANEWFFAGHYPEYPIMPGVLIVEAIAQAGAVMMHRWIEEGGRLPVLAGIERARFRRAVRPGDTLRLEVEVRRVRGGVGVVAGRALVDGQVACEAELWFASSPSPTPAEQP